MAVKWESWPGTGGGQGPVFDDSVGLHCLSRGIFMLKEQQFHFRDCSESLHPLIQS